MVQPGAQLGKEAYCPVSGVVFPPNAGSAKVELGGGKTLYFCCEGCATYFKEHRAEVVALRSY